MHRLAHEVPDNASEEQHSHDGPGAVPEVGIKPHLHGVSPCHTSVEASDEVGEKEYIDKEDYAGAPGVQAAATTGAPGSVELFGLVRLTGIEALV